MAEPVQIAAGIGGILVIALLLSLALTWRRVVRLGRVSDSGAAADVMLVFGAEAYPSGHPSPELEARLLHTAALYRQGRAGIVLCSGGHPGPRSEPRVMRAALIRFGVRPDAILIDESGNSTRRSIAAVRRLGAGRWRRALLVSSPYHLHRILTEARRQGVPAIASPAPSTPIMRRFAPRTRQQAREVAAIWWYAISPVETGRDSLPAPAPTFSHPRLGPLNGEAATRRLA